MLPFFTVPNPIKGPNIFLSGYFLSLNLFQIKIKVLLVVFLTDLTRGVMTEFQEKLRQQHEESMHRELEALLSTANKAEAEVRKPVTPLRKSQFTSETTTVTFSHILNQKPFSSFIFCFYSY